MSSTGQDAKDVRRLPVKGESMSNHPAVHQQLAKDVLTFVIALRFLNALCVATFFQPDEYFQALEPAWQIAFGHESGAWITWEWQYQLRSSLHPALFALFYYVAEKSMIMVSIFPQFRAMILVFLPKAIQGTFAAAGDYYTWKLAEKLYGTGSNAAWTALMMSVFSPWQWFCSTRTLCNSLETVLTIVAMYFWPWEIAGGAEATSTTRGNKSGKTASTKKDSQSHIFQSYANIKKLRICLLSAGIACILRPTNLLIWVPLLTLAITRIGLTGTTQAKFGDFIILFREIIFCGTSVLITSSISDRLYFGMWTFPPYQWLNFNITQSLAVFYGVNDWHYFISQGLPLLLTTYLPFVAPALWSSTSLRSSELPQRVSNIRFQLSFATITMISALSIISHKEVRFIYPLLPSLHILLAPHVLAFFSGTSFKSIVANSSQSVSLNIKSWRRNLLILLVLLNIFVGYYTTFVHQRGVLDVMRFLRVEYEETHLSQRGLLSPLEGTSDKFRNGYNGGDPDETFAAFLMPCHSTPWRSHLIYPTLKAWALSCEPPLHIPANTPERAAYLDEGDLFYHDPVGFLKTQVNTKEKPWPRYVVGFQGIESVLKEYYEEAMPGWKVKEKWRGFNSHWHDDSRRHGDVVVWEFVDGSKII